MEALPKNIIESYPIFLDVRAQEIEKICSFIRKNEYHKRMTMLALRPYNKQYKGSNRRTINWSELTRLVIKTSDYTCQKYEGRMVGVRD